MVKVERKGPPEGIQTASLQFKIEPESVRWLFATLSNQPEVTLFNGEFFEPFTQLRYLVAQNQGQLVFAAQFGLGEDFRERYGSSIGSPEDLAPLLKRYPEHQFSPDNQRLVLLQSGQVLGMIARVAEDKLVIQRGGQAGQVTLSEQTPVNSLTVSIDKFNLLVQRYVNSIWRGSRESDQKQIQHILELPEIPEGATRTYLSTFEILGGKFAERPREVDLYEHIGGYPRMKAVIEGLVLDFTDPEASRGFGTQPFSNRLILISGNEGTGKSLFPKGLYWRLRLKVGDGIECYRLPFQDMFLQYGPHTATVAGTILDHTRQNEKNGVPTIVHLDGLQALISPYQRPNVGMGPSAAEFNFMLHSVNPVLLLLRDFGRDIGGQSRHVIVYGESREPRERLPEVVSRMFRRSFSLDRPTVEDMADIIRVQIGTTRFFAEQTEHDPFTADILLRVREIAQSAQGLVGRDIQQALLNIATGQKARWDGKTRIPITELDIVQELTAMKVDKGIESVEKRPLGFHP